MRSPASPSFFLQALDVNVDRALQDDRVLADGGVHQLEPGERTAGLAEQDFQQAKLGRGQRQLLVAIKRPVAVPVDDDPLALDHAPATGSSFNWRRRSSFLIRSIRIFMLYGLVT